MELSYNEKPTGNTAASLRACSVTAAALSGRYYCDQPEMFPRHRGFPYHACGAAFPANTTAASFCAPFATSGICAAPASPTCTDRQATSCFWAPRPQLEEIYWQLTHDMKNDLGGSGSNLRTPSACLGMSRCEFACYNTQDISATS